MALPSSQCTRRPQGAVVKAIRRLVLDDGGSNPSSAGHFASLTFGASSAVWEYSGSASCSQRGGANKLVEVKV